MGPASRLANLKFVCLSVWVGAMLNNIVGLPGDAVASFTGHY